MRAPIAIDTIVASSITLALEMAILRFIPAIVFLMAMDLLGRAQGSWIYGLFGATPDPDRLLARLVFDASAVAIWVFGLRVLATPYIKPGAKLKPWMIVSAFVGFFFSCLFLGESVRRMKVGGNLQVSTDDLFFNLGIAGLCIVGCFIVFNFASTWREHFSSNEELH